ncbi:MAG: Tol-Pal system beta propeller repeat protein TolB [Acetobacter sp.]|nr:Tol-Pal system beta propeller repeat protein TolB [Acetobacter sp.]
MKKLLSLLVCAFWALSVPAHAQLNISISGATQEPIPVAFPKIISDNNGLGAFFGFSYADKVRDVVLADLERSGLFRIINERSYIQKFSSIDEQPIFGDWRVINAQVLIQSVIMEENGTELKLRFKLWDIISQKELMFEIYTADKNNWRRMAHSMADAIYERLTGDKGYFNTVIAYISESGPSSKRVKRLALMDQDGDGHQFLTSGANLVLTPRFSPDMRYIAYLSFINNKPRVYMYDLRTQRTELLGNFPGMTFAPAFSPDSKYVLMSYAKNGITDIYEMDLATRQSKKLTSGPSIDTSPSYSPDGTKIVFNSDRGGNQQLYVMDRDGSNVERISFKQGARYATPVWSPRGDYIAFTRIYGGQFQIGVMYPDGTGERILANGFLVEGPTWSPNGRVLMFYRQNRGTATTNAPVQLYSVDITGQNERMVITPGDGSDPAWSPLL